MKIKVVNFFAWFNKRLQMPIAWQIIAQSNPELLSSAIVVAFDHIFGDIFKRKVRK